MTILDRVAHQAGRIRYNRFRPTNTREYFALRIAQKLGDSAAARHYVDLVDHHAEDRLLCAFHDTREFVGVERSRRFHAELEQPGLDIWQDNYLPRLAAIRVERRSVTVFIMNGRHPEHIQVRQLSSTTSKAVSSARGFINRLIEDLPFSSAAIEPVKSGQEIQRGQITRVIIETLREHSVSMWEVSKHELFAAFGHPALHSRRQVREVISDIWPSLNDGYGAEFVRDAAALALYCQTERQFIR